MALMTPDGVAHPAGAVLALDEALAQDYLTRGIATRAEEEAPPPTPRPRVTKKTKRR